MIFSQMLIDTTKPILFTVPVLLENFNCALDGCDYCRTIKKCAEIPFQIIVVYKCI